MLKMIALLILAFVLASCNTASPMSSLSEPSPEQQLLSNKEGLSLVLEKDNYVESPLVIATTITNDSMQDYGFGDYFYIELNKEGKWYILTHSDAVFINNPQLNDFGHVLAAGEKIEMRFSIEDLGIELAPGEYRLVKTFLAQQQPFYEISIAAPFSVD